MRRNDGSIIKGEKRSMRAKKGLAAAAACLTLLVGSAVPVLAAQATGPAAESAWLESGCDVNELEAARDATQLFVVPKSIPIILPICSFLPYALLKRAHFL